MRKVNITNKKFNILSALSITGLIIFTVLACFGAMYFPVNFSSVWNIIAFAFCFIAIPVCVVIFIRNHRVLKIVGIISAIIIIVFSLLNYYSHITIIKNDVSEYLKENTDFVTAAAYVLPENSALNESNCIAYLHTKGNAMFGYEAIELTAVYSAEAFEKEAESLAEKYNDIESNNDGFPFFFQRNAVEAYEYYTFSIYGTHYAVTYKVNESEYSISYLFFENQTLSYMTLPDAMECCDYHSVRFSDVGI